VTAARVVVIFAKTVDAEVGGAYVSIDAVSILDATTVQGLVVAKINGVAEILGT